MHLRCATHTLAPLRAFSATIPTGDAAVEMPVGGGTRHQTYPYGAGHVAGRAGLVTRSAAVRHLHGHYWSNNYWSNCSILETTGMVRGLREEGLGYRQDLCAGCAAEGGDGVVGPRVRPAHRYVAAPAACHTHRYVGDAVAEPRCGMGPRGSGANIDICIYIYR